MNKEAQSVHLKFSSSELDAIDRWGNSQHIRTRSEAIRQLIRRAINLSEGGLSEDNSKSFKHQGKPDVNDQAFEKRLEELIEDKVAEAVAEALEKHLNK